MQFTPKQIIVWNGNTQLILAFSGLGQLRVVSFSERLKFATKTKWQKVVTQVAVICQLLSY